MTVTDLILTVLLLGAAWNGYQTGFVMQAVRFVGIFVAYWAAKTYGPQLTPWLQTVISQQSIPALNSGYRVISFAIVFIVGLIVTRLLGQFLQLVVSLPGLSLLNRIAGILAGVVIGVLLLIVVVNLLVLVPNDTIQSAIKGSQIASAVLSADISRIMFTR